MKYKELLGLVRDHPSKSLEVRQLSDDIVVDSEQKVSVKLRFKRIRSGVRRRIMDRLGEGRATVANIAKDVGLRMPHASAELKRLREDGLIASDEETGARGAQLALTASGWDVLRGDEIARLQALPISKPPSDALGRIVSVSGENILIAFVRRPVDGPLAMPTHPLTDDSSGSIQFGDTEWNWLEPRERRPRWLDSTEFQPVPAPVASLNPGHLDTWGLEYSVVGLQRFRSIEPDTMKLGIGSWFGEPKQSKAIHLPRQIPMDGEWRLGSISAEGSEVRPSVPIIGIGLDRLSRESLLLSAAVGAVVITAQSKLQLKSRAFPVDILEHWMKTAHSRLRNEDRIERLIALRNAVLHPEDAKLRRKVDDSTWRKFRQHWGDSEWSSDMLTKGQLMNTNSLSRLAESAVISWALEYESDLKFCLEISSPSLSDLFQQGVGSHFRIIMADQWSPNLPINIIQPHPVLPSMWAQLSLESIHIPINLASSGSITAFKEEIIWKVPTQASEVIICKKQLGEIEGESFVVELSGNESMEQLIRAAVLCYPIGNEDWANRMEIDHPIVAWIASAPEYRWSRWQRLQFTLGRKWLDLMEPSDIPLDAIASAAINSPPKWSRYLADSMRKKIRIDEDIAHQLRQSAELAPHTETAWVASILCAEIAWLNHDQQRDVSTWGLDRFIDAPPSRCHASIIGIDWLSQHFPEQLESNADNWRLRLRNIAFSLPTDHDLNLWAQLDDWFSLDARPTYSVMRLIVERLPEEWWAPVAETLLTALSEDSDGIEFLGNMDVAWPALILRPKEEEHRLPGGTTILHGGVRRTLLARIERLLERSNWFETGEVGIGAQMISDLKDALQSSRTLTKPRKGRTHPRVGWLAVPIHLWPPSDLRDISEGDPRITSRLIKNISGWHSDLSRNPFDI